MLKNKVTTAIFAIGMMAAGAVGIGLVSMASAQSASTTTVSPGGTTTNSAQSETTEPKTHGHAPLGGDGIVSSITGTSIVMGEESNEGGASYTVDASKATITVNGTTGTLSDIKVGEKIFVQGTVSGTDVAATSVSVGHPGGYGHEKAGDTDGSTANEASEPASSSSSADQ